MTVLRDGALMEHDGVQAGTSLEDTSGAPPQGVGSQGASASSSRQRNYDEFLGDWCTRLDHPYVPWDLVERSHAEFLD
jgi:hypothetical protein